MPVLSIITINYNNKTGLEKTIRSVSSQTEKQFEFIVIDGGSGDGSPEVIEKFRPMVTFSVSEPDRGIYDAQNKGITNATGKYLLFLNSGDTLFDETVVEDFYKFVSGNEKGIVYGNTNLVDPGGKKSNLYCPPEALTRQFFFQNMINHQACFIKRELFFKYGLYSLLYKFCADFDFFVKVFINSPQEYQYFNCIVCNYEVGGYSSAKENYNELLAEKLKVLRSHLEEKEFKILYANYRKTIPLKYRALDYVYKTPLLNFIFNRVFPIYKNIARNGKN
jgi:glycosyltransferase involved in cell wall biosynthesis